MTTLSYKPNFHEVQTRLRSLWGRQAEDRIFATMAVPNPALARFAAAYPHGPCADPDVAQRTAFWDDFFRHRAAVDDDAMPAAYLSEFHQGLYGGLLGGTSASWPTRQPAGFPPCSLPLLGRLVRGSTASGFDAGHHWWRRTRGSSGRLVDAGRGRWGVSHFILIDGLNFVFEFARRHADLPQPGRRPEWSAAPSTSRST